MPRPSTLASTALAALAVCLASSAQAQAPTPAQGPRSVDAPIMGANNAEIGRVHLAEGPRGVLIRLDFDEGALRPGWHGVHFHEHGACNDQGFQASGAHVGHAAGHHGLLNVSGPEPGDLPSIYAPASGAFSAELFSPFVTLEHARGRAALLDADGAALVVHAARDDQIAQPIGGAGARVGCAVIRG